MEIGDLPMMDYLVISPDIDPDRLINLVRDSDLPEGGCRNMRHGPERQVGKMGTICRLRQPGQKVARRREQRLAHQRLQARDRSDAHIRRRAIKPGLDSGNMRSVMVKRQPVGMVRIVDLPCYTGSACHELQAAAIDSCAVSRVYREMREFRYHAFLPTASKLTVCNAVNSPVDEGA
ncbi:MAG: hypothetical protein WCY11_00680 [Novosphingobium sp.]